MMARTREQINAARRAKYAENKKRKAVIFKFYQEILESYTPKLEAYLRRCINEDKPAKLSDFPFA